MQPTPEQLAVLSRKDRFWLRVALLFNGPLKWVSVVLISTYGLLMMWFTGGRRFRYHGLEHLSGLTRKSSIVLVANHRSFFDFYTIAYTGFRYSRMPRRSFFPVRAAFFYDGLLGAFVNFTMCGMAMFPPVMRERRKLRFNRWSLDRLEWELRRPGTMVGIHPEGKRNKDPDPYTFLKPQPGVGHLAMRIEDLTIIPVFVKGMTNRAIHETWLNWTRPSSAPIDIRFGAPIDYADLYDPSNRRAANAIADRAMGAIESLAAEHRAWEDETGAAVWPERPTPVRAPAAVLRRLRASFR